MERGMPDGMRLRRSSKVLRPRPESRRIRMVAGLDVSRGRLMHAPREMTLDMLTEKTADGIGENQRVIKFRRHVFINHRFAAMAEPGAQQMGILVIGDGFDGVGLKMHGFL
jgi:hypothetical protein